MKKIGIIIKIFGVFLLFLSTIQLKADNNTSAPTKVFGGYDIYATTILREGDVWKQWFGGWMKQADLPWDRMYYSVSNDNGNTWSEPLEIFTITNVQVNDPSVIRLWDPEKSAYYYQMYYTYYPSGYGDPTNYIAVSTSPDGINWTHLGNQDTGVLIGADNGIDMHGAWAPSAVSLDSLGNEVYLYFHNNIPTGVYRTTLSGKGLVFNKETTISVTDGFKANVDVTIAPDKTWWMFYNNSATMTNGNPTFQTSKMYSKDGIHWIGSIHNPIQAFSDKVTVTPHVVWEDEVNYQLWHGLGSSFMDLEVFMQRFQLAPEPAVSVTASSVWTVGGIEAQSARDGNPDTYWSSDHPGGETEREEWIALDLAEVITLSKITLTPRIEGICFPVDFEIQTSTDGSNWTTIDGHSYTGYKNPGNNNPIDFKFQGGLNTRYIRIFATRLADIGGGFFMFQLTEFDYTERGPQVTTSSEWIPDFSGANAIDGNPDTYWASNWPGGETDRQEWIARDFGERITLSKITLTPRTDGAWFPVDFEIQTSADGSNWATIPSHSYTNYPNPGNAVPIDFVFADEGIRTQYIRVFASKLSDFGSSFYMFHLTEFEYTEKEIMVSVSTSSVWIPDFSGNNAIDGDPETYWASNWPDGETDREEWIALDFGERLSFSKIILTPRTDGTWFPVDFEIQTSGDGSEWTTIPGQSYTNYPNPGSANPIDFLFDNNGVTTQYIRIFASKLSDNGSTFYMFHLAEIEYSATRPTLTIPDSPLGVKASEGNNEAVISFMPPSNDGGSAILFYTVQSNPGNIIVTSTESPITVTGLSNGTTYTFTATATNELGESAPSLASNPATPFAPTVPDAPFNIVASLFKDDIARITFSRPEYDGGSSILSYTITSNPDGLTETGVGSPMVVTGLREGITYTFTVFATNSVGNSIESLASNEITTPVKTSVESIPMPKPKVYQNQYGISIELTSLKGIQDITLFDISGKKLSSYRTVGGETFLIVDPLQKGVYIIKIQGEGLIHTSKLILK